MSKLNKQEGGRGRQLQPFNSNRGLKVTGKSINNRKIEEKKPRQIIKPNMFHISQFLLSGFFPPLA